MMIGIRKVVKSRRKVNEDKEGEKAEKVRRITAEA